jgi:hypothetical protein
MEGFRMNVDTAEEFFLRCVARKATTEKERLAILNELVQELRTVRLNEKDLKRQLRGKKVIVVKRKLAHNSGPEHYCHECGPRP